MDDLHTGIFQIIPVVASPLVVGVSFGVRRTAVRIPVLRIGIVCCAIPFAGVLLSEQLEDIPDKRMEISADRSSS